MGRGATSCLLLQCARAGMGMPYEEVGMTSRGRLHGGRPHARRQRYARGMGLESTKIRCTTLTSITRRASIGFFRVPTFPTLPAFEGRAWEACTVGGVLAAV